MASISSLVFGKESGSGVPSLTTIMSALVATPISPDGFAVIILEKLHVLLVFIAL